MRHVVIEVDDDRVRRLAVTHYADEPDDSSPWGVVKDEVVPVPQGDKLIRDVDRVTGYAIEVAQDEIMPDIDCGSVGLDINAQWKGFIRTARRLRAAFNLDMGGK